MRYAMLHALECLFDQAHGYRFAPPGKSKYLGTGLFKTTSPLLSESLAKASTCSFADSPKSGGVFDCTSTIVLELLLGSSRRRLRSWASTDA
jgi:hypothetical protein